MMNSNLGSFYWSNVNGINLSVGNFKIWSIRTGWNVALIVDDFYKDHKSFNSLEDAIKYALFQDAKLARGEVVVK